MLVFKLEPLGASLHPPFLSQRIWHYWHQGISWKISVFILKLHVFRSKLELSD